MTEKRFILASASPRRKELFLKHGYKFEIIPSKADETLDENMTAYEAVRELSKRKAMSVSEDNKGAVVFGCDTVVALDEKILGKPHSYEEAYNMLKALSGRKHCVYTGVCITDGEQTESFVSASEVEFYDLSDEMIEAYIKTGEPMDKAGAYGIQDLGAMLVKKADGDYYTIVGLPLAQSARALARFGIHGTII